MVNPRFVIKAVLSGQRLNINVPLTVAGTVNYIGVEAKCTSEWDDCTVVCYLYQADTGYTAQLGLIYDDERKLYYFPNAERLTLTAGEWAVWFVGVMAESGQETYRVTSDTKYFNVYPNPFASSIPPGDISLDEEAIARATDAQNKANLLLDKYNAGELTGPQGEPGDPAEIGFVQASVDNTTGNPGCVVTVTENPENTYNMQFAFSGIKGAKGDKGDTGEKGDTGAQGVPGRDGTDGRDGEDGRTIDDYVLVQAEQPTSETNKMWLKPAGGGEPIMIPSAEEFNDLESTLNYIKQGNADGFINAYVNNSGVITTSTKTIINAQFYNYNFDNLNYIKCAEGYEFTLYVWKKGFGYAGTLRTDGSIKKTGTPAVKKLTEFNLRDYPADLLYRIGLNHIVSGSPVDISPSEASNITFYFEAKNALRLSRKRISVIGDSISTFTGYTSPGAPAAYYPSNAAGVYGVSQMYWSTLAERMNMVIDTIDAYGGSTVGTKWKADVNYTPFTDESRLSRLGTPDVIIVEGGINDFGGNPLGNYPTDNTYSNMYEFRTSYAYLLNQLKTRYPAAKIVCLSMLTPKTYNNTQYPEKQTEVKQALASDTTPHYLYEFNAAIKELCARYGCVFCDIYDIVNYYINTASSLGPHPTASAHLLIANRIQSALINLKF